MSKPLIAVIAAGAMGSGVGARLSERGAEVLTNLPGRSAASLARAEKAGMRNVGEAEIAMADFILSIVPPSEAMALAQRLAPAMTASRKKPIYIDCNAVSSGTAERIGEVVSATGAKFIDGGIIGPPVREGARTVLYVCGAPAATFETLSKLGLDVRWVDGPIGAASALKMAYAGITKGLTALAAASILGADRYGAVAGLRQEMTESQPHILTFLDRQVPDMFPKAYRFVGEMEEVAAHGGRVSTERLYRGMAQFYQEIADDFAGAKKDIAVLEKFTKGG